MRIKIVTMAMAALSLAIAAAPGPARAEASAAAEAEMKAAWQAAEKTATFGPARVKLLDQGSLAIAPDEAFIPAAEANRIMAALGNLRVPARYGLVVSRAESAPWMVDISWVKEGYIRDGDAKEWEPDALLDSLKQATDEGNAQRVERGMPPLDVTGWVERPNYDAASHQLVWSLSARERNAPATVPQTINYNTYALGREGYFALDLITTADRIASDKKVARGMLASLEFARGKRYADFNGSTDRVAAYGLAGLIGVVAIKKLGLLAIVGVFLLKVWKIGFVALAAGGAMLRRFFKKRQSPDEDP
jgi:uncharacterized membrane-anchored protein